jgi:exopolysaccharide production protein ExoQ
VPPVLALILWLILLLALLYFDPAKEPEISMALWIPVIWIFILGSRLPSQWLGVQADSLATALEEGNPIDRAVWLALILLALGVLISRSFDWGDFSARNLALMAYLAYCLLSVLWSDMHFVAFKKWFRDLGDYLVVLVVVSDLRPVEALRTVLRRVCYLLIPLSVLLVKYYRGLSVVYDPWSGMAEFAGATTSKNMLGVLCLISGLYFFWDTVTRWADRHNQPTKRIIFVNLAFIAMTLWLLRLAHSATSSTCLALGCVVIAAAQSSPGKNHRGLLKTLVPASFFLYLLLVLGFGLNSQLNEALGRTGSLTDRTRIWAVLLDMHTNPILGTGYESFWLGSRLNEVWAQVGHQINEAHNGYLDVYLNLGLIGLSLMVAFLVTTYRTICRTLDSLSAFGSFSLAVWITFIFHNVTEANFGSGLPWLTFLLAALAAQVAAENSSTATTDLEEVQATGAFSAVT